MCVICKGIHNVWKIELKDKTITVCPNCLAYWGATLVGATNDKDYEFPTELIGNATCEITNKPNAIKIYTDEQFGNETYRLKKDIFIRFICHDLKPNEYLALLENGHSRYEFMIHDDFYSDYGYAYQPIRKGLY